MADILFKCPNCASHVVIDSSLANQNVTCTACEQSVLVPTTTIYCRCGSCQHDLQFPPGLTQMRFTCPNCEKPVTVPARSELRLKTAARAPSKVGTRHALPAAPSSGQDSDVGVGERRCPHCLKLISSTAIVCFNCNINLLTGQAYGGKGRRSKHPLTGWTFWIGTLIVGAAVVGVILTFLNRAQERRQEQNSWRRTQISEARRPVASEGAPRVATGTVATTAATGIVTAAAADAPKPVKAVGADTATRTHTGTTAAQAEADLRIPRNEHAYGGGSAERSRLQSAIERGAMDTVVRLLDEGADPREDSAALFCSAINRNDLAMYQLLLDRGADPNHFDTIDSPVHMALQKLALTVNTGTNVTFDIMRIAVLSVNACTNLNRRASGLDYDNETPLGCLLRYYYSPTDAMRYTPLRLPRNGSILKLADHLLTHGANPNARPGDCVPPTPGWWRRSETLLQRAVRGCDEQMIDLLLRHGADIEGRNADGNTALHLAAAIPFRRTRLLGIETVAPAQPAQPPPDPAKKSRPKDVKPTRTPTPRNEPRPVRTSDNRLGSLDTTSLLGSKAGAGVTRLGSMDMTSLLGTRTGIGGSKLVPLGASDLRNMTDRNMANASQRPGDPAAAIYMAGLLLELGADIHAKNARGQTPLHLASDLDIIAFLLRSGGDVNATDAKGNTPLLCWLGASDEGRLLSDKDMNDLEIIRKRVDALLAAGADVNIAGLGGNTALHYVGGGGWNGVSPQSTAWATAMIRNLMAKGARLDIKNYAGVTALDLMQNSMDYKVRNLGQSIHGSQVSSAP